MWNALSWKLTRSPAYKIRCRWFDSARERRLWLLIRSTRRCARPLRRLCWLKLEPRDEVAEIHNLVDQAVCGYGRFRGARKQSLAFIPPLKVLYPSGGKIRSTALSSLVVPERIPAESGNQDLSGSSRAPLFPRPRQRCRCSATGRFR